MVSGNVSSSFEADLIGLDRSTVAAGIRGGCGQVRDEALSN